MRTVSMHQMQRLQCKAHLHLLSHWTKQPAIDEVTAHVWQTYSTQHAWRMVPPSMCTCVAEVSPEKHDSFADTSNGAGSQRRTNLHAEIALWTWLCWLTLQASLSGIWSMIIVITIQYYYSSSSSSSDGDNNSHMFQQMLGLSGTSLVLPGCLVLGITAGMCDVLVHNILLYIPNHKVPNYIWLHDFNKRDITLQLAAQSSHCKKPHGSTCTVAGLTRQLPRWCCYKPYSMNTLAWIPPLNLCMCVAHHEPASVNTIIIITVDAHRLICLNSNTIHVWLYTSM